MVIRGLHGLLKRCARAGAGAPVSRGSLSEQLRLVAFGTEHLTMNKGRELFREGERADCGFLIVKGRSICSWIAKATAQHRLLRRPGHVAGRTGVDCASQASNRRGRGRGLRSHSHFPVAGPPGSGGISGYSLHQRFRHCAMLYGRFRHDYIRSSDGSSTAGKARFQVTSDLKLTGSKIEAAITGTWSDGLSQPRASFKISMTAAFRCRSGDDQTWSSRARGSMFSSLRRGNSTMCKAFPAPAYGRRIRSTQPPSLRIASNLLSRLACG